MLLVPTRFGLIACGYLAQAYYEDRWVSAPQIASLHNMNVRVLTQALHGLTRAGLLKSQVGGKNPGFMFAKDPAKITLLQILDVLEYRVHFKSCRDVVSDMKCEHQNCSDCTIYTLFCSLVGDAVQRLSSITVVEHFNIQIPLENR